MRALIIGAGIGGLATAVALHRVGIEVAVFERAEEVTEVGVGLSLWSNAVLAARRLGIETELTRAGSVIEETRTLLPSGRQLDEFNVAAVAQKAGAPTICVHRAELQRVLLDATRVMDTSCVHTGRKCIGCEETNDVVSAFFPDGSRERGDILIGADGINSVVRKSLFGEERPRDAGYFAWRGIAHNLNHLLGKHEARFILGQGTQAGLFHCGGESTYWFLTSNGTPTSSNGPDKNIEAIQAVISDWKIPLRDVLEATEPNKILLNKVVDLPPRDVWGVGHMTLIGDAIHATTPNLGQGACQAMEDAVVLAHALATNDSAPRALRSYETKRRARTKFITEQSWQLGKVFQLSNPAGIWLRNAISQTRYAERHSRQLFERLLLVDRNRPVFAVLTGPVA